MKNMALMLAVTIGLICTLSVFFGTNSNTSFQMMCLGFIGVIAAILSTKEKAKEKEED